MKKVVSLLLVLALALSVAVTASADISYPTSVTAYMTSTESTYSYHWLYISDFDEDDPVILKSSVKSSKSAVASVYALEKDTYNDHYDYLEDDTERDYGSTSYYIGLKLKKTGTAKISFKYNNKTYKSTVKVLAYKNPVSTLKVTGLYNNKNMKALTATDNYVSSSILKSTKTVASPVMTVKAASGWKIASVHFSNYATGESRSFYFSSSSYPASVKLPMPAITKGDNGYFYVRFYNTTTQGTLDVDYSFGS